jgi:phosphopantothenoylcysteine decarboxylase/phosphopantothenate--cysteine ligase
VEFAAMAPLKRILLIVAGGIAAYKSLELIRRGRERGYAFRVVLTKGGAEFVTPLSFASLSGDKVYQELFSLTDEAEMGHIRLSREADLVVVAPASADLMAKMAHGRADDLASTALLATDKPVLIAPAMNVMMWANPATQANLALLKARGIHVVGPGSGDLACGEEGSGRLSEPAEILDAMDRLLKVERVLSGVKALVTSGPTHEPIDPVRYIANRSSGKQGHAIAAALAELGAETILVSGPTREADPAGVALRHVETAAEMLAACEAALPVDVAICAAAVADWRPAQRGNQKIKKNGDLTRALELTANPDILATLAQSKNARPRLVVGFAAETEKVVSHAQDKLKKKCCDWILANDVSEASGTFGGERNTIHLVSASGIEDWPSLSKAEVARRLARRVADFFKVGHG